MLHGTTVATNLILEGKSARTALVTTAGFRHVLEIGRQDIPRHANLFAWVKPRAPGAAGARARGRRARSAPAASCSTPLDEASVHEAAAALRARSACRRSRSACCTPSPIPRTSAASPRLLRAALPDVAVTASVDVLPVVREYERSLATVLNAGVMPAVSTYVARLRAAPDRRRRRRAAAADAVERRRRRRRHDPAARRR